MEAGVAVRRGHRGLRLQRGGEAALPRGLARDARFPVAAGGAALGPRIVARGILAGVLPLPQAVLARLLALLRALGAGALDVLAALGALRRGQAAKLAILTPALRAFVAALAQPLGAVGAPLLGRRRRAVLRLRRLSRLIALRGALPGALLAGVAEVLAALGALGRRQPT
jgi:hypothetical protein